VIPLLGGGLRPLTWIHSSRFGYRLRAIPENENTAMAVGVNPAVDKLLALLPSAVFTSLAGSIVRQLLQLRRSGHRAQHRDLGAGGADRHARRRGDRLGPILGSIVLTLTAEIFKTYFEHTHLVVYGLLLIVVVVFLPAGSSPSSRGAGLPAAGRPIGAQQ
jgi:branched-chain amino acid transport system permease protein